jgi:hypothetical protein
MADTKKPVVIRVNVAKNNTMAEVISPPRMVTEWNHGRIAFAACLLVVVVYGFFTASDTALETTTGGSKGASIITHQSIGSKEIAQKVQQPVLRNKVKPPSNVTVQGLKPKKKTEVNKAMAQGVIRARLAQGVANREPFGQVETPVQVNKEFAVGVFFFTELNGMKGQSVSHVWKHRGKVIFEKKKIIRGNRWRTYTSKLLTAYSVGPWSVELVNEAGVLLHVVEFDAVLQ